jgi:bromodomain-containing protein 4
LQPAQPITQPTTQSQIILQPSTLTQNTTQQNQVNTSNNIASQPPTQTQQQTTQPQQLQQQQQPQPKKSVQSNITPLPTPSPNSIKLESALLSQQQQQQQQQPQQTQQSSQINQPNPSQISQQSSLLQPPSAAQLMNSMNLMSPMSATNNNIMQNLLSQQLPMRHGGVGGLIDGLQSAHSQLTQLHQQHQQQEQASIKLQLQQTTNLSQTHSSIQTYVDPLEQSLASFEQAITKPDIMGLMTSSDMQIKQETSLNLGGLGGMNQRNGGMNNNHNSSSNYLDQSLMQHLNNEMHMAAMMHAGANNGYSMDNGNHGAGNMFMNQFQGGASIFDPVNVMRSKSFPNIIPPPPIVSMAGILDQQQSMMHAQPPQQQHQQQQQQQQQQQHVKEKEKYLITPKPIEDLLINPNSHQKMTSPDHKMMPGNFAQAFNKSGSGNLTTHEQNLKNASSWSSLASANSPQSHSQGAGLSMSKSKPTSMNSFEAYRNKAKEMADRQKALERNQKVQAEKEMKRQQEQKMKQEHHVKQQQPHEEVNGGGR